jgi:hypothetical protein
LNGLSSGKIWCREGVEPPLAEARRILSLILGILQGVALRRKKSQQAFYLQTDTRTFEIAM